MDERQKRMNAESELEGFRAELKEAYQVIVELRYI